MHQALLYEYDELERVSGVYYNGDRYNHSHSDNGVLTAYDGYAITYDAIGNPLSWYNGTSFTWELGCRLMSATNAYTGLSNSYTYNADGLRLTKTVGTVEHKYVWQGSQLISEYYGGKELHFFYDESGAPKPDENNPNPFLNAYILALLCCSLLKGDSPSAILRLALPSYTRSEICDPTGADFCFRQNRMMPLG